MTLRGTLWLVVAALALAPVDALELPDGPVAVALPVHVTKAPASLTLAAGEWRQQVRLSGETTVHLTRRDDWLTIHRGAELLANSHRPPRGPVELTLTARGATVGEPVIQPLEPVYATDDFLREEADLGAWEPVTGQWRIGVYRDPLVAKYELPSQATWYEGTANDGPATSFFGEPFWGDYRVGLDIQLERGNAGLAFGSRAPEQSGVLQFGDGRVRLFLQTAKGRRTLAEARYDPEPGAWARLEVVLSGGHAAAWIDGTQVLAADLPAAVDGRVGAWTDGAAKFDNLRVTDCRLLVDACRTAPDERWGTPTGPWQARDGRLTSWCANDRITLLPAVLQPLAEGEASVSVRVPHEGEGGLEFRPATGEPYQLTLRREGDKAVAWLCRGEEGVAQLRLADPDGWHRLRLQRRHAAVQAWVDDQPLTVWYDTVGPVSVKLTTQVGGAAYRDALVLAEPVPPAATLFSTRFERRVLPGQRKMREVRVLGDLLVPQGRGWRLPTDNADDAGRLYGLPKDQPLQLWYHDELPGDAGLSVQLDELADQAALELALTEQGGYRLVLTTTRAVLRRAGEKVAELELSQPPRVARLWRDHGWLAAEIDGRPLVWHDPSPWPTGRVGVLLSGGRASLAALTVTAENAFATRFDVVDSGWRPDGAWRWNSGMSCVAWSHWITGDGRERPAFLWRREPVAGDLTARFYLAEYTDGYDDPDHLDHTHQHFALHDVSLVLGGDGHDPDSGYRFVLGADGGRCAQLRRRGKVVLENPGQTIVMGSHCNNPREILVDASRADGVLVLKLNGVEALRYEDPEPLPKAGHLALGVAAGRAIFNDLSVLLHPPGS